MSLTTELSTNERIGFGVALRDPIPGLKMQIPRWIELGDTPDGEPAIWWRVPAPASPTQDPDWKDGALAQTALTEFSKLADEQDPQAFLSFAKKYGVLGLWPFRSASGHKVAGIDYWVPSVDEGIFTPYRFEDIDSFRQVDDDKILYEPIDEWRHWASWAKAALRIGYRLQNEPVTTRSEWAKLGSRDYLFNVKTDAGNTFASSLDQQRVALAAFINQRFVEWSGLRPTLTWIDNAPVVTLTLGGHTPVRNQRHSMQWNWPAGSLFPTITAQLLNQIGSGEPLAVCGICGSIFPTARKPRTDRPLYCSDECRAEARRKTTQKASAKWRSKQQGA